MDEHPIRSGASACLLGHQVRFDGGHRRHGFLSAALDRRVEWVPICPEVQAGMGVPRPPVRLVDRGGELRMLEVLSGRDHTDRMRRFAERHVATIRQLDLHGFVLKKDSPSCGVHRVTVHSEAGGPRRTGRGLFAEVLLEAHPLLPVEEDERLSDSALLENFIERAIAYRALCNAFAGHWTPGCIESFHEAHELQLMARSPKAQRELTRLLRDLRRQDRKAFRERYERGFMQALAKRPTRGQDTHVAPRATERATPDSS
jgi:uncharacterized protein YbbK (DUF523 family)